MALVQFDSCDRGEITRLAPGVLGSRLKWFSLMGGARSGYNDASRRISQVKIKRQCLPPVKRIKEKLQNEPNFTADYGRFFRRDILEAPNSICPPAMTRPRRWRFLSFPGSSENGVTPFSADGSARPQGSRKN
ncbi:MAG TPA: hypothetical protein VMU16_05900 [Candidatus Binataceae bacterium]|nr:hypothetical protein [Candidatus Binataceae bacterium]